MEQLSLFAPAPAPAPVSDPEPIEPIDEGPAGLNLAPVPASLTLAGIKKAVRDMRRDAVRSADALKVYSRIRAVAGSPWALSPRNSAWLASQAWGLDMAEGLDAERPGAGEFRPMSWFKSRGLRIRKGSKALAILAPLVHSAEDDGSGHADDDGSGLEFVTFHVRRCAFRVSDLEDSSLEALREARRAELLGLTGGSSEPSALAESLWAAVQRGDGAFRAATAGDSPMGAAGWTDGRTVHVVEGLGAMQSLSTWCHERTHHALHFREGAPVDRAFREVQAELGAVLAMGQLGLEASEKSAAYVADWGAEAADDILEQAWEGAEQAARDIADMVRGWAGIGRADASLEAAETERRESRRETAPKKEARRAGGASRPGLDDKRAVAAALRRKDWAAARAIVADALKAGRISEGSARFQLSRIPAAD